MTTTTTYLKWEKLYIFWERKTYSKFGTQFKNKNKKIKKGEKTTVTCESSMIKLVNGNWFVEREVTIWEWFL